MGSTVSTATGLGWNGWGFPIEHFSNRFNLVWCRLKKLINQTNRKQFFPNRTRKNPTNLKWLIPIEHDLSVQYRHTFLLIVCILTHSHSNTTTNNKLLLDTCNKLKEILMNTYTKKVFVLTVLSFRLNQIII